MIYGNVSGGVLVVSNDPTRGKPVTMTDQPEIPSGYKAEYSWDDRGVSITQVWRLVPEEGTAQDAALRLTMLQAQSLPDEVALGFVALYPEWIAGESYTAGQRVKYKGTLYKVLQGHVSQADWTPDAAPSLFAKVLPGQEGNEPEEGYGEWVQPDSTNGYSKGDRVSHNGKIWESTFDGANVWEPGVVGTEALWKDITDEVSSDDQGGVE